MVLIARILFAAIFVASGIGHLTQTEAMAGYAKSVGVPAAKLSVIVSGVLMVVGSLSILLGIWGDLGSLLILVAVAPIAFLMHQFWKADGEARMNEQIQFNKTLSLAGGALALFALFALFALVPELGLTVTGPLF
ncbi:DoxX family protein [Janibacter indicus]|uniref:DoxX family protein n=1 Tax=Janibacter indicus TaxID=857417 RepID=A0A7L9J5R2_9MICO|nr:DoxX family protein [Janibacter indicus]QOK24704.1 DoxX family protein [Janibacter indicus]